MTRAHPTWQHERRHPAWPPIRGVNSYVLGIISDAEPFHHELGDRAAHDLGTPEQARWAFGEWRRLTWEPPETATQMRLGT
ncbi:MAG: hypothetical protein GY795_24600 [Desulfobacterales bacterium]|nr:hypothetical protein [Desulfobacterales bacterium]